MCQFGALATVNSLIARSGLILAGSKGEHEFDTLFVASKLWGHKLCLAKYISCTSSVFDNREHLLNMWHSHALPSFRSLSCVQQDRKGFSLCPAMDRFNSFHLKYVQAIGGPF